MDRPIVYTGAIPLDTDLLFLAAAAMEGQAWQAQGLLGTGPYLTDLTCTQTVVASLAVLVNPGQIFSLQNFDASAYSDLGTNSNNILKQGILRSAATIGCAAPVTVGFSINYLIEVGFLTVDGGSTVLPYYNASNPLVAWAGPANSGTSQNTRRNDTLVVQAKAGTAATTGTQTTPSADSGFVGAFVVTVAQGQTTITSSNISQLSTAPFFTKLPAIPAAIQASNWISFDDTGSVNAAVITPIPAITAYAKYQRFQVKFSAANTGPVTININGLGTKAVTRADGSACVAGDFAALSVLGLVFDGTQFQIQNLSGNNFQPRGSAVLSAGSGNFTVPAGVTMLKVRAWSGGGGGGGSAPVGAGAGGNSGGYAEAYYPVTPGQVIPYVVGGGGAGGATGGSTGSTGGTTSFSPAGATAISITGGGPGSGGGSGSTGASASATGPGFVQNGASGENATLLGSSYAHGGAGGASFGGGPCFVPFCTTGGISGNAGSQPGGGGSGGGSISANAPGGAGGAGKIIVEY